VSSVLVALGCWAQLLPLWGVTVRRQGAERVLLLQCIASHRAAHLLEAARAAARLAAVW
jgi:hypothetical protein